MGTSEAMRQKYWSELTDGEKIEKLRDHVASLARALVQADKVIADLLDHNHSDGQLVVPMENIRSQESLPTVISLPYELRKGLPKDMA